MWNGPTAGGRATPIRILHVSDLHATDPIEEDQDRLATAALDHAARLLAGRRLHLLVCSGDLTKHGRPEEYERGRSLLLEPAMDRFDLGRQQVVLVPGNHEIAQAELEPVRGPTPANRAEVDAILGDPRELARAAAALGPWATFRDEFYGEEAPAQSSPLSAVHEHVFGGVSVGVAALNSSWRSRGKGDRDHLLLGHGQVAPALRAISDREVRLVVVHHPLDWLVDFDARETREELARHGVTVLSGHVHSPHATAELSEGGERLDLTAGCLYYHREYPNSFSLIEIDPTLQTVGVQVRRWYAGREDFDADLDLAPGGQIEFPLPLSRRARERGQAQFSQVIRRIGRAADALRDEPRSTSAEIRSVEDVIVEPPFLSRPHEEVGWTGDGGTRLEPRADPSTKDGDRTVLIVHGARQMGKTSALLWELERLYRLEPGRMPAYMTARESKLGTVHNDATLAKAADTFGFRRSAGEENEGPLLLAIDDIDGASPKRRGRIFEFISDNPEHAYLLSAGDDCATSLAAELEEAGVDFEQLFLGTFGYRELCLLAERVASAERADPDQVASLIVQRGLPRTPATMRTLLAVSAAREQPDDHSEQGLLAAYADRLLCVEAPGLPTLGLDPRQRVHLLAEVARVLDQAPGRALRRLDAEKQLVECLDRKGLSGSAGHILEALVRRGVLVERGKLVAFRSPALQQMFLGHWMVEGVARRESILADCGRNREAIRHGAWLRRNDPQVLRHVNAHAAGIAAGFGGATEADVDARFASEAAIRPWQKARLDIILRLQPTAVSGAGLYESDRLMAAIERELAADDRHAEEARELGEAIELLADVIRNSELVDDVPLKREALETAIEGAVRLIGALTDDDDGERSFRRLVSEQLEAALGGPPWHSEHEEKRMLLIFALTACRLSLQRRLEGCDLTETIAGVLDQGRLERSPCADCLATWLYVCFELPGWPRRLAALLDRLAEGSLLRDATMAACIERLRSRCSEPVAEDIVEILVAKNATRPRHRRRVRADLAHYRAERPARALEVSSPAASLSPAG